MNITTREECYELTVEVLAELLDEMGEEPGEIAPSTLLNADLGISSVDIIHVMIMLEDALGHPLNFQELATRDGEYVDDLTVGELVAFTSDSLGLPASTPHPVPG